MTYLLVLLTLLIAAPAILLLVRAIDARDRPELRFWHTTSLVGEFTADHDDGTTTLEEYLRREERLFDQVREAERRRGPLDDEHVLDRYAAGSFSHPDRFERDWNRTLELKPETMRGGVLLVHGLTDAPYSLRAVAERLRDEGLYVLAIRLPGHGTFPQALCDVHWEDWTAAVRLGMRHVTRVVGKSGPTMLGGYSLGGTLCMHFVLEAMRDPVLTTPARVFLMSPAIGVTAFAGLANTHKLLSWSGAFRKYRWHTIEPEHNPFKYSSIAKNAGRQVHLVSREVQSGLADCVRTDRMQSLPPIFTAQSVVDSTVISIDLVEELYDRIEADGSELLLFDVNRRSYLQQFMVSRHPELLTRLGDGELPYVCTLVTNESTASADVVAQTKVTGETAFGPDEPLDLAWPAQVYSLSHIALPFPPDDPVYGEASDDEPLHHFRADYLQLRGEREVLSIPADTLLRMRYNPFYSYMEERIVEFVGQG